MRAFIYIRVSTEKQAKEGDSVEEQEHTLTEYAKNNNMEIVGVYRDEGVSGTKIQREGLELLLDDVQKGKGDIILFTFLSRWFRSSKHYLNTQEILDNHNVAWRAVREDYFNTDTPVGRMMITQMMGFAQLESEMTSQRIKAVFDHKVKNGEWLGGTVPLGYKVDERSGKKRLAIDEEKKQIIKDMFEKYASCRSFSQVQDLLKVKYNIIKHRSDISKILKKEIYIGRHERNLEYCPPIIEKELFFEVQNLIKKNIKQNKKIDDYIFVGVLKCTCCGSNFSGNRRRQRYKKQDGTISVYEMKNYISTTWSYRTGLCDNKKVINERVLEKYLIKELKKIAPDILDEQNKSEENKLKKKTEEENKLLADIESLKKQFIMDSISVEDYKKSVDEIKDKIKKLDDSKPVKIDPKILKLLMSDDFDITYAATPPKAKRELWDLLLVKVEVDVEKNYKPFFKMR